MIGDVYSVLLVTEKVMTVVATNTEGVQIMPEGVIIFLSEHHSVTYPWHMIQKITLKKVPRKKGNHPFARSRYGGKCQACGEEENTEQHYDVTGGKLLRTSKGV